MEGFVLEMITFCINLFSWVCAILVLIWLFIYLVANPLNRRKMRKEGSESFKEKIWQNEKWLFRIQVLLQITFLLLAILWCVMENIPAMLITAVLLLVISIINCIKVMGSHGMK